MKNKSYAVVMIPLLEEFIFVGGRVPFYEVLQLR